MNERKALLATIEANPKDDTPKKMNRKRRMRIRRAWILNELLPISLWTPCGACHGFGRRPGNHRCLPCGGSGVNHRVFTYWGHGKILKKDGERRLVQFPQYTAAGTVPAGSLAVWVNKGDLINKGENTVKLATVEELSLLDFIGIMLGGKMTPEKRRILKRVKDDLAPVQCTGPLACDVCRGRGVLVFLIPLGMQTSLCTDCEGTGSRTVEIPFGKFLKSLSRRMK